MRADDDFIAAYGDRCSELVERRAVRRDDAFDFAPIVRAARIALKDISCALKNVAADVSDKRADHGAVAVNRRRVTENSARAVARRQFFDLSPIFRSALIPLDDIR